METTHSDETQVRGEGVRKPIVDDELIERLMAQVDADGLDLLGPDGVLSEITSRVLNRALQEEMTDHVGYERGDPAGRGSGNSRNGSYPKSVLTDAGGIDIDVPRDRNGTFEPQIVPKGDRRLAGFNDTIIGLVSRGMTTRDVQAQIADMYGVEITAALVSRVTDGVLDELRQWQNRPLDRVYTILYLDAIVVKVRDGHTVANRPVYIALGVDVDGFKHVLGLWLGKADEGAKFWLGVLTELRNRGLADVLIVCCDGLSGFPDAIEAVWPHAIVQTCVVHLIRNSIRYCSYKDRRGVTTALKTVYRAETIDAAADALDDFELERGRPLPRDRGPVAAELGTLHAVPELRSGDPQGDLHHERDRVAELPAPQGHQDPRALPDRGRRTQDPLHGDPQHRPPPRRRPRHRHLRLETSTQRVRHLLPRTTHHMKRSHALTQTP